jgi:hypothetical protein
MRQNSEAEMRTGETETGASAVRQIVETDQLLKSRVQIATLAMNKVK